MPIMTNEEILDSTIDFFKKNKIEKQLIFSPTKNKKLIMSVDVIRNDISYIVFYNDVGYYGSEDFKKALESYESIK